MNLAVLTLAQQISNFVGRAPELRAAIKEKLLILDRPLEALSELQTALGVGNGGSGANVDQAPVIEGAVTIVTPAAVQFLMQLVLFLGTLFFFITGRSVFRKYIIN